MSELRLFGPAREAAGTARATAPGRDVAEVLRWAEERYGTAFTEVLACSRVWLNGEPVTPDTPVGAEDEVAVVPPVSGG